MSATMVTAYIPIPGYPRSEEEFAALGRKLFEVKRPTLFARADKMDDAVKRCWLFHYLNDHYEPDDITHSVSDNPDKNTLAYHIVQAQKTEWLAIAAYVNPFSDVFVWVDYGIFHVPGVTKEIIESFLDRAEGEQAVVIPGCWEKDSFIYNDKHPCWRFAGGVMVVPRRFVEPFNTAMQREYAYWISQTKNVSWEVNTLARLERTDPDFPVWWYKADHDQTLFTNYPGAGHGRH